MDRLFVYGTLAPGEPNAHIMEPMKGTWLPGKIRGTLYPGGWGAALGYPGIVLDSEGDVVSGQVFTSSDLPAHWQRLDEFEGAGYVRSKVLVMLNDETQVSAYVYTLSEIPT